MTDYRAAELETDALIDAWHARLAPITQAEIDATIGACTRNKRHGSMSYLDDLDPTPTDYELMHPQWITTETRRIRRERQRDRAMLVCEMALCAVMVLVLVALIVGQP